MNKWKLQEAGEPTTFALSLCCTTTDILTDITTSGILNLTNMIIGF